MRGSYARCALSGAGATPPRSPDRTPRGWCSTSPRKTPVTANRTRCVLLKMYGWAVDSALLDNNPISGTKKPHREGKGKTRILRDDEIRVLWRALDSTTRGAGTVAALKTILLLGQRPGEVSGMAVDELHDLENPATALWTIPRIG